MVLAITLSVGVTLAAGIYIGQRAAYSDMGVDPQRYRQLQQALPEAQRAAQKLKRRLSAADTRHQVDRAALELVRQDLAQQQEQIADLDEGLRFYRSLMAPGEIAQGFSLRGIELVARDKPGRYGYRIVVQQEARKHETMRGKLQVHLLGLQESQSVSYSLAALTDDMENNDIPLRFRYFQAIEGELALPEGFQVQTIDVLATVTSPRKLEVGELYPWQIQEKFTHVGK